MTTKNLAVIGLPRHIGKVERSARILAESLVLSVYANHTCYHFTQRQNILFITEVKKQLQRLKEEEGYNFSIEDESETGIAVRTQFDTLNRLICRTNSPVADSRGC